MEPGFSDTKTFALNQYSDNSLLTPTWLNIFLVEIRKAHALHLALWGVTEMLWEQKNRNFISAIYGLGKEDSDDYIRSDCDERRENKEIYSRKLNFLRKNCHSWLRRVLYHSTPHFPSISTCFQNGARHAAWPIAAL